MTLWFIANFTHAQNQNIQKHLLVEIGHSPSINLLLLAVTQFMQTMSASMPHSGQYNRAEKQNLSNSAKLIILYNSTEK